MNSALIDKLLQRPIAFHRIFADVTGSATGGLFLSQAYYWSFRVTQNSEGWFYKTQEEWHRETMLSRREQEVARKSLKTQGILEEKKEGIPCKLYFRLNRDRLYEILEQSTQTPVVVILPDATNSGGESDKVASHFVQTGSPDAANILYTENTSEINSEITSHNGASDFSKIPDSFSNKIKEVDPVNPTTVVNNAKTSPPTPEPLKETNVPALFDKPEQAKYEESPIEDVGKLRRMPNGKLWFPWENPGRSRNDLYNWAFAAFCYEKYLKRFTNFTKSGLDKNKSEVGWYFLKAHTDELRREKLIDMWNEYVDLMTAPAVAANDEQPQSLPLDGFINKVGGTLRRIVLDSNFTTAQLEYIAELWESVEGMPNREDLVIYIMRDAKLIP